MQENWKNEEKIKKLNLENKNCKITKIIIILQREMNKRKKRKHIRWGIIFRIKQKIRKFHKINKILKN